MANTNNSTNNDQLTTNGQLLIGKTSGTPVAATITAGTGITVTNGSGSITIASSGGAVANFAMGYGNSNNNFIIPFSGGPSANTFAVVANTLYCCPIILPISTTFTKIGIDVTVGSAATSMRLGIYDNTGTGGYPGAKVLDAGTVSTAATATVTATISQVLQGSYWLVGICNSSSVIITSFSSAATAINNDLSISHLLGFTSVSSGTAVVQGLSEASVSSYFTALPSSLSSDTFTAITNGSTVALPLIFLKV